jgi:ATP-binding cassette subfamily C protein RsaD
MAAPSMPTPLNEAVKAIRPAMVPAAVFSLFINLLALVSPIYMLQVYDRVMASRNMTTLLLLTVIAAFLYVVYGLLESVRTRVLVRGGAKFESTLRQPLFTSSLAATLGRNSNADAQAFRDADTLREFVTGSGILAFFDAPWVPLFVLASFALHPWYGWLAIAAGIVSFGIAIANEVITKQGLGRATRASIAAQADVSATLRNAEVMRAMGMAPGLQKRWGERRDDQIYWQAATSDRAGLLMAGSKTFRQMVYVLGLGLGAYLAVNGELSAGGIVAGSILVGRALAPIDMAVAQWKGFVNARGAWERLQNLFRATANRIQRMDLPAPLGALKVEQLVAGAPGTRQAIIRGVSFDLERGDSLAIIGPSAAGKSSLARVILGVWPAAAGTVRLDGFDITHWDPDKLGPYIGYLPQDVELFSGTIAQNICRFREADHADIIRAAQLAGVHEMIQHMPDGYDTQLGDGGQALSGGQRQRVGLARAVFGAPSLVVLDEPNANLDSSGEEALIQAVRVLKEQGTTVIFITHKTNMLAVADKIVVMDQGTVRMFGERDEVLAKVFGGPKVVSTPQPAVGNVAPMPLAR